MRGKSKGIQINVLSFQGARNVSLQSSFSDEERRGRRIKEISERGEEEDISFDDEISVI